MNEIALLLVSLLIASFLLFFSEKISEYFNLYDNPNSKKIHIYKTSYFGGSCIFFPYIFFVSIYYLFVNNWMDFGFYASIIVIISGNYVIGLYDDKYNTKYQTRFFLQIFLIILSLVINEILQIEILVLETINKSFDVSNFSLFFTLFCILTLINAINLVDGQNGLLGSISIFWLFYLSTKIPDQMYLSSLLIIFSLIGFLILNLKGKIFLGNSGSYFLGAILSMFTILAYKNNSLSVEQIFILFIVPGLDMTRLFIIRLVRGKSPFEGDRKHLHHFLLKKYGNSRSLIIYFILNGLPIICYDLIFYSLF